MKQGQAQTSKMGSTKVEPTSHAVSTAYAAGMGIMKGNHSDMGTTRVVKVPMYEGRGLKAPMAGVTSHKAGSQGNHK